MAVDTYGRLSALASVGKQFDLLSSIRRVMSPEGF